MTNSQSADRIYTTLVDTAVICALALPQRASSTRSRAGCSGQANASWISSSTRASPGFTIHALAKRAIMTALEYSNVPKATLQKMIARGETELDSQLGFYDRKGLGAKKAREEAAARLRAVLNALAALGPTTAPRCRRRGELP